MKYVIEQILDRNKTVICDLRKNGSFTLGMYPTCTWRYVPNPLKMGINLVADMF